MSAIQASRWSVEPSSAHRNTANSDILDAWNTLQRAIDRCQKGCLLLRREGGSEASPAEVERRHCGRHGRLQGNLKPCSSTSKVSVSSMLVEYCACCIRMDECCLLMPRISKSRWVCCNSVISWKVLGSSSIRMRWSG